MIHISQIGVRDVMVFTAHVKGPASIRTEDLNPACKLRSEVEVSSPEHAAVEVKKSTSGSEKWLDAAVVYPIHLRTNGTATSAVGIMTTRRTPWVSHECHWNNIEYPTDRDRPTGINQPGVAAFELVQPSVDAVRKGVLVFKLATEPCRELIERWPILCTGSADKEKQRGNRTHQIRKVAGTGPAIEETAGVRFDGGDHAW